MKGGRIALLVIGVLLAMLGLGVAAAGAGMLWADGTRRGPDGYLTSPTYELAADGHALRSEQLLLDVRSAEDWVPWTDDLAVRLHVQARTERPVFAGVGPSAQVDSYLAGVAHSEVTRLGPASTDVDYQVVEGVTTPAPPGAQEFWAAQVEGSGAQDLAWDLQPGSWTIVVMNADAAPGVAVTASAGALAGFLRPLGAGLSVAGLLLLAGATGMIVAATAGGGRRDGSPPAVAGPPADGTTRAQMTPHPVRIEARLDEPLSRGLWLVKWILVIPHVIVLVFLWLAFAVLTVAAGVAILVTGRYPRGIFDFNVGVIRWTWRVAFYSFSALGTDAYPPFSLERANHPATFEVAYPTQLSRGLVLIKWLLAIPHLLIVGLLTGGGLSWTFQDEVWGNVTIGGGGGLIGLLTVVAGLVLLVRGRYPRGVFDFVMGLNRWVYRVVAYVALMTDVYPPFRLDPGGGEPHPPVGPPTPQPPLGQRSPVPLSGGHM